MADTSDNIHVLAKAGIFAFGDVNLVPCKKTSLEKLNQTDPIIHLSAGYEHTVVVCASGRAYSFGKNEHHAWMGKDTGDEPSLVPGLDNVKITRVTCGFYTSYFLDEDGALYVCGKNHRGQLGLGVRKKCLTPALVEGLPPMKKVVSEASHTVLLSQNCKVWVCGWNEFGQLGRSRQSTTPNSVFAIVPDLPPVTDIACGSRHTVLLTESGTVLVAGSNQYCQLGSEGENSFSFQSISLPVTDITAIACGFGYTVALAGDRSVWAWGYGGRGQLGNGEALEKSLPARVLVPDGHTVASVCAGGNHTALVTTEGEVLVCGEGESGELGPSAVDILKPTLLQKTPDLHVKQMAFGLRLFLLLVVPHTS